MIGEGDADRVNVWSSDVIRDDRMTALIHRRRGLCGRWDWRRNRTLLLRIGAGKRNGQNSKGKGSSVEPSAHVSRLVVGAGSR